MSEFNIDEEKIIAGYRGLTPRRLSEELEKVNKDLAVWGTLENSVLQDGNVLGNWVSHLRAESKVLKKMIDEAPVEQPRRHAGTGATLDTAPVFHL